MAQVEVVKPDAKGKYPPKTLDIALVNGSVVYDLSDGFWDYFTLQLTYDGSVTLGSMVGKVQVSNDGSASPVDFPTAVTLSSAGMTALLSVTSVGYVHYTITTAGTSGIIRLSARTARRKAGI